jgi:putative ABC transport system permease protein
VRSRLPLAAVISLAARNVGRNKARSALALAAIACGVAGLILSGGFVRDILFQLGEALIHSQSGHIQVARSGYFDFGARSPSKYLMSSDDVAQLGKLAHVDETMRRMTFSGLASNGRASHPILGEGIEAAQEAKLGTFMVLRQGRTLSPQDRYGALVGAGVARALGLKPGSPISLIAPTVDEAMNTVDLEVVGIFESFSRDYDNHVVKIALGTAQELLNTQAVNVVILLLDRTDRTAAVAGALKDRVGSLGLELRTWEWLNDFYWKAVALYDRQFGVLRIIVLIMVILAVLGAINMAVLERAGEFGTMRALGNTARDVIRLVLMEGVVMGALGGLIGVALGCAVAWIASSIGIPMPPPPNSNLEYNARIPLVPSIVFTAFLVGFFATVIASLLPALRVSRLPIVEALRRLI